MTTFQKIKQVFLNFKYRRFVFFVSVFFSLLYHVAFLIIFRILEVYPMFYFNFFSVAVFLIVTILAPKLKSFVVPYAFCFVEVVAHQILADWYIGGEAAFHFFILIIGLLPILSFSGNFKQQIGYGIASFVLFMILEALSPNLLPRYDISTQLIRIIRMVNIGVVAFLVLVCVGIYSAMLFFYEGNLEKQVAEKTDALNTQNGQLLKLQNHLIISLSSLVENRDTDTGDHIKKTSAYCRLIAQKALENNIYTDIIDKDFIEIIERAAPMHDIGKILVPDAVLKKTGRFTPEEFEQMKLHTTQGVRIINEVIGVSEDKAFVKMAVEVASSHHERWDGEGYPFKVKGEDIPVSGRIMAIADVYDALVSERCYKAAMPSEKAFEIIREDAGSHFDPVLADIFLNAQEEVLTIQHSLLKTV